MTCLNKLLTSFSSSFDKSAFVRKVDVTYSTSSKKDSESFVTIRSEVFNFSVGLIETNP
ncbi:hypothetical protein D3C87_1401760 [compost metagenome]